ncbi:glycosyltransferase family 2 protein [Candidatus Roizmanbacteria bacterium]|nr:glycosyltransferase family 2 protein [Candidatus Roizmanbacteria bacterium]
MITAVVLTKNEEKNIKKCLDSLSWCDEIIIVDDCSEDKTADIAKELGAKVYSHKLNNDFSEQRNLGLSAAQGDWVLFVDADEEVSQALWFEIMAITNDPKNLYAGFYIKRKDFLWDKELKYGELGNLKLLRLAKKDAGKWTGKVHEIWKIKGNTLLLQNALLHYPHQTVKEFLQEINYYSSLRAMELHKKKIKVSWWSIIFYPKAKFIVNYFFKGGFQDGLPGLVFAIMMSFHSFLVRGKLWLLWQKNS